ncbi:serine incorporator 3 isoform X1 [Selaginella moellendorffii]|uniref:serine incorporator 3 isoform X1 n=1 Tax=Selaginella moellendorffii TaxID=88036 RepID=UPI000D1C7456|nr:serine incorporator 3 isoform X1 [Selaginella moellendorffii]|eukprot:XP_024543165.1 serine incorporator 3 isoform X1 [Selaginella moellendorffii]
MAWCFCCSCAGANQMPTRYIYAIIFLFTNLIAWVVRDYSREAFRTLRHFQGCYGVHTCLASEGVLRLSFGCFVFFAIMFVTTVGTSRIGGLRDGWHCGWWPLKFLLWILLMILPFFVPPAIIKVYGEIARFGAGVFLVIQLFSIVNFAYWWNEKWLAPENSRRCFLPMLIVTTLSYVFCLIGLVIMYVWFAPKPSCSLNIFFISWTLVLLLAMTLISLHPKVSAGLMTSGLISLYIVFLCWSAIMSEPRSEVCNTRPRQTGKADLLTVLSFFMGLVAIVFATFSTGADSNPFVVRKFNHGLLSLVFVITASKPDPRSRKPRDQASSIQLRVLPLRLCSGIDVLRHALRRLEPSSNNAQMEHRRWLGERVGEDHKRMARRWSVYLDDGIICCLEYQAILVRNVLVFW